LGEAKKLWGIEMTACSKCTGFLTTIKETPDVIVFECNGCGDLQVMRKELKANGSTWGGDKK
jgi:hypothetical protein